MVGFTPEGKSFLFPEGANGQVPGKSLHVSPGNAQNACSSSDRDGLRFFGNIPGALPFSIYSLEGVVLIAA
jgi:hypothetical protein